MEKPKKKISRKDLANLNSLETLALAREVYGKLFSYMKPYRWRFYLGVFFEVLSGLSNGVLILGFRMIFDVVLPVKRVDASPIAKIKPPGFWSHFDLAHFMPHSLNNTLTAVILACVLVPMLILLRSGLTYIANYLLMWVGNRILLDLRNDAYKALMNQSISYYSQSKIGNLVQTVFNQARVAQQNLVALSQDVVQRPVAIIASVVALVSQDITFTVCSLIVFPLCILPVVAVGKKVRKSGSLEEEEAGAMLVLMNEAFAGIKVVKSHAREDYEVKRFNTSNAKMNKLIMRYAKAGELVGMLVEAVASLGVGVGLYYAWRVHMDSNKFMTLVAGLMNIYPHAKAMSRMQLMMQKTLVATSSVFAVLEERPTIVDADNAITLPRVQGHISIRNLAFTYKTSKSNQKPAVNGVTIEMEPGRYYALVGPSGAGKSTLFALLQRFYDPDQGCIQVDGVDIREVTQKSLRENLSTVSQDVFLFHDTITENIRYGRLNASKSEVVEAAKQAHAHEFIREQEFKYDTVVGDKGNKLSGGQAQRVSIARAILRNAPILLLDEAMSALDSETEMLIQEAMQTLSKGKTVIAIAHRLSTILEAHKIVVMNHGNVLDIGNHAELMQRCELYQRLYHIQFRGGNVDPDAVIEDVQLEEPAVV